MFHVEHIFENVFNINDLNSFLFLEKEYFKWVDKVNISSIKNKKDFWLHHVFDSLCLLDFLKKERNNFSNIYDLGSGAGFPGLILSIMMPEKNVFLIEPVKKKTDFSNHIARHLGLSNLKTLNLKYQDLDVNTLGNSIFVSRALGQFDEIYEKFGKTSHIIFMTSKKEIDKIKNKNYKIEGKEIYLKLNECLKDRIKDKILVFF